MWELIELITLPELFVFGLFFLLSWSSVRLRFFPGPLIMIVLIAAFAWFLRFFSLDTAYDWITTNWTTIIKFAVGYVVIGVIFSIIKWWLEGRKIKEGVKNAYRHWQEADTKREFYDFYNEVYGRYGESRFIDGQLTMTDKHKGNLVAWTAYWWVYGVDVFFGELVFRFFENVVKLFGKLYSGMLNIQIRSLNLDTRITQKGNF